MKKKKKEGENRGRYSKGNICKWVIVHLLLFFLSVNASHLGESFFPLLPADGDAAFLLTSLDSIGIEALFKGPGSFRVCRHVF